MGKPNGVITPRVEAELERVAEQRARLSRRQQALLAAAGEDGPAARWYVLTVAPGCDNPVDNELTKRRVDHWMVATKYRTKRRRGSTKPQLDELVGPALAGYLFVRIAWTDEAWSGLQTIEGVVGVLGGPMRPSPLKEKEIETLRERAANDPTFMIELSKLVRAGDQVRIEAGPFAEVIGIVTTLVENSGRAKVDADLFGRKVSLDLDVAQLSKSD